MENLLIIEDDKDLREGLAFLFQGEGYGVYEAGSLHTARECLDACPIHGIILDCNLPDGNGFDFCLEILKKSDVPILMLTARDSELDEVKALELRVNDYMSKPFSLAVLKARVKKLLHPSGHTLLRSGSLTLDLSVCKATKNLQHLDLSAIEFKLLAYFLRNKGILLSKEQILAQIWEQDGQFVDDNIVSVNISRLRAKIEDDPKHPKQIKTVHGMGYIWKEGTE